MKIIIKAHSLTGVCLYPGWKKILGVNDWNFDRTDKKLIKLLEDNANKKERLSKMDNRIFEYGCYPEIVNIPDETTDWVIAEYDGKETLHFVVNGEILTSF